MIRTLIVEDDVRVAEVHQAFVHRVPGFTVVGTAHTAKQAIALARELAPDLVLLDMYLPDHSGLDVLQAMRRPGSISLDVIAITAARYVETLRAALQWGVLHYLVKPFQFKTFRERLESYAAARSRLTATGPLDQAEVDRIVSMIHVESAESLPKGMSTTTLGLVSKAIHEADGDLSATEVAERIGVSRVTSRRYLDYLTRRGLVVLGMRYGSSGRPEHRFRWAREPSGSRSV
ncbi:MAG: response regulator [Chloroflexota bacterium]